MKSFIRLNSICLLLAAALAAGAFGRVLAQERRAPQPASERAQRIAPPAALKCSRNHLTSFTGRVLAYRRAEASLFLRVRTDEETTESFTLKPGKGEDLAKYLLLRGATFQAGDWEKIEASKTKLKTGVRVTVWVCDDGSQPVLDWRPPEA